MRAAIPKLIVVLRKKGSKTKKRMKEEEIEKGNCGPPTRKVFFVFVVVGNVMIPVQSSPLLRVSPISVSVNTVTSDADERMVVDARLDVKAAFIHHGH